MNYTSNTDDFALVLTDDGNGGLLHGSQKVSGSVNYATGEIVIDATSLLGTVREPQYSSYQIFQGVNVDSVALEHVDTADVFISAATASVSSITTPDTRNITLDIETGLQTYDVLQGKPFPHAALFNTWIFELDGTRIIERNGMLYRNWNNRIGASESVGTLSPSGKLTLSCGLKNNATLKILQGVYVSGNHEVQEFVGRTNTAPIKPQSFTVYADTGGNALTGKAQVNEQIIGEITGRIVSETGFFSIKLPQPIAPDTLRYNAVSQSTVPLDSSVIGINATRLPLDGKVPIFRTGDLIVIHNTLKTDIGSAFTAGQTINLPRKDLDRLCVMDMTGKHIDAEKYDYDLDAGTLTWRTPLDLSDYQTPFTALQIWEEDNRIVETTISGGLKLQNPVSRYFPEENTFVSSAIIGGDLIVRATKPFSQQNWTKTWQNTRIGDELLAKLNVKDYPIVLTADGAISERWLLKFTSGNQFELYGESLGLVGESDTLTDLAPINPATNKPYFTLPAAAFGGGWAAQNCIRFNTQGTPMPVWVVRAVQPSAEKVGMEDGWRICLRGDTVEV